MIVGIGIWDFNKMFKMVCVIEGKVDEIVVIVDYLGYYDLNVIVD